MDIDAFLQNIPQDDRQVDNDSVSEIYNTICNHHEELQFNQGQFWDGKSKYQQETVY
jgi:hypothetical protein